MAIDFGKALEVDHDDLSPTDPAVEEEEDEDSSAAGILEIPMSQMSESDSAAYLDGFSGGLITQLDGIGELNPQICVLTDTGDFFVDVDSSSDPVVQKVAECLVAHLQGDLGSSSLFPPDVPVHMFHVSVTFLDALSGKLREGKEEEEVLSPARSRARDPRARADLVGILREAVDCRASDVHIYISGNNGVVEMRVDGLMRRFRAWPADRVTRLLNTTFYASDDNPGGERDPHGYQSARIAGDRLRLPKSVDSLRLQFAPQARQGSYLCMRLAYSDTDVEGDVDTLGYHRSQVSLINDLRLMPHGISIISGVAGSGKSTTLQKILRALVAFHRGSIKIFTIEDPPEGTIDGVSQLPVLGNEESSKDREFEQAISASLRLDPDVIMIGEIRDGRSAQLAIDAAVSGHQVWTTTHATSAVRALLRLSEIGVKDSLLLDPEVVSGLIGQRLIPRLCPRCSVSAADFAQWLNSDHRESSGKRDGSPLRAVDLDSMRRVCRDVSQVFGSYAEHFRYRSWESISDPDYGCSNPKCLQGYEGRTVVAEVVNLDSAFGDEYRDNSLFRAELGLFERQEGLRMSEHAFLKMLSGDLSPLDVRVKTGFRSIGSFAEDRDSGKRAKRLQEVEKRFSEGST